MKEADCTDLEVASSRVADAIRYTEIPNTSRLFIDYLYNYEKVSRFYSPDGRRDASLADRARRIGAEPCDREALTAALDRINRAAGSSELTFKHIDLLKKPGSVAIVTGQQAGLFTGPLYTVHKALTVIKLAACMREQGIDAVPVFWVASEDHDYQEVNHTRVVDKDGRLQTLVYEAGEKPEDVPVGQVKLCSGIKETISELLSHLPASEFMAELERDLRESYVEGIGFAQAFSRLNGSNIPRIRCRAS